MSGSVRVHVRVCVGSASACGYVYVLAVSEVPLGGHHFVFPGAELTRCCMQRQLQSKDVPHLSALCGQQGCLLNQSRSRRVSE